MGRWLSMGIAIFCMSGTAAAGPGDGPEAAAHKTTIGGEYPLLSAGAEAIRSGLYDEGIGLTLRGLQGGMQPPRRIRAAALSNLCAAYAAKQAPDTAIDYCTQSLEIDSSNWRAHSNRSYAYWLKGDYAQASMDLEAAAVIAPKARQVVQIRGMINEARLEPRVVIEEHQ